MVKPPVNGHPDWDQATLSAYWRCPLREVLENITGGVAVLPSNPLFRLVHVKFLLAHKICNYGEIVPKKSDLKDTGRLSQQSQQTLTASPFSLLLSV